MIIEKGKIREPPRVLSITKFPSRRTEVQYGMVIVWSRSSTARCAQTFDVAQWFGNFGYYSFVANLSHCYMSFRPTETRDLAMNFGRRIICPAIMLAHWYVLTAPGDLRDL